jgi:hypothetical protein
MAFAWLAETWQLFVEAVARCESGSGQPVIGLPQRVAGKHDIPLWLPGACGSKCRRTRRFARRIVSQCFWTEKGVMRCRSRYVVVDGGP